MKTKIIIGTLGVVAINAMMVFIWARAFHENEFWVGVQKGLLIYTVPSIIISVGYLYFGKKSQEKEYK